MALLVSILIPVVMALAMYLVSARATLRTLDQNSRPLADPVLNRLTDRLAQAAGMPGLTVHVFDIPQVNGLAAPDGRIFLTRGFIDRYRMGQVTAEELAGVIAHELGHVAMGHVQKRVIDMTGGNALFVVLAALLSRFIPIVGVWIAQAVTTALAAGLSRKAEHEADAYASALLVKAGIGTEPQKSLFRKLARLTDNMGQGVPDWLRSHPQTEDRIARIEAREAKWGM
jgi:putative metalloprotease